MYSIRGKFIAIFVAIAVLIFTCATCVTAQTWDDDWYDRGGSSVAPTNTGDIYHMGNVCVGTKELKAQINAVSTVLDGTGVSGEGGHAGVAGRSPWIGILGQGCYGGWFDGNGYFSGNVSIGTIDAQKKLHIASPDYEHLGILLEPTEILGGTSWGIDNNNGVFELVKYPPLPDLPSVVASWSSPILLNDTVTVTGDLNVLGTKNFVQADPDDPSKEIVYVSLEGPEAGTYIRGTAQLVDGEAVVNLPEHFSLVTSDEGLTVQLTPVGEWLQLYVVEKSTQQIVVHEANGKDGQLDYIVQGVRKGYENHEVIRDKE